MKLLIQAAALFVASTSCVVAETLWSQQILPANFKPPQVFKNTNLVRNINVEKGYVRESINVVIENVDKASQNEYYFPFDAETIGKVGGLEVRDKKDDSLPAFDAQVVEYDATSSTQFYRVTLLEPLAPKAQQTLAISYHVLSSLSPLPATIEQQDKQYLQLKFSEYSPSAYVTKKQKTKVKFPNADVPDYTGKPDRQGSTFTYGPFDNIPAGAQSAVTVRYEYTKPIIHATALERDIEISHWGGNAAFEERFWLGNRGAQLASPFSRVLWATQAYYSPPTSAIKDLRVPLKAGSISPYFTDEIGNVSTSNFRSSARDATLELRPRYPVFGGWSFPFRIGWDNNLKNFLRKLQGDGYILNVPFLEGPKMPEGISYEKITVRVILPEGALNVKFQTSVPLTSTSISNYKTFMDTVGRTTLTLHAVNVIDESRDKVLIVTYDYPYTAGFRKPLTIFLGILSVFLTAWTIGQLDMSIGKKKK